MSEITTRETKDGQGLPFTFTIAIDAIKESYPFILIAVFTFFVGVYLGADNPTENYKQFVEGTYAWRERVQLLGAEGDIGIAALLIFFHNSFLAVRAIWLSFVIGIYPVANALVNGKLVGSYLFAFTTRGITPIDALEKIAPHGGIEMLALLISSGVGMWCFHGLARREFRNRFARANRVLIFIVLPAIAIAAIIEAKNLV